MKPPFKRYRIMKLKDGLEKSSRDPWYDLAEGGYLDPHKMCVNKDDADRVVKAVKTVQEFISSCEDQIEDFLM